MDASELAQAMLRWEQVQREADALRAAIEAAVMEIGATQKVGNVTASYSNGRRTYDYRRAIDEAGQAGMLVPDALEPFTKIVPATVSVDYRLACKHLGIEDVPFTQSEPSVTVKLA